MARISRHEFKQYFLGWMSRQMDEVLPEDGEELHFMRLTSDIVIGRRGHLEIAVRTADPEGGRNI